MDYWPHTLNNMNPVIIFTALLIGSTISVSACLGPQNPPLTPLERVLAMTPASFANFPLEFSDFKGALELRGYERGEEDGYAQVREFWFEQLNQGRDPFSHLALPPGLSRSSDGQTIGLPGVTTLAFDLGIWYFTGFVSGPYANPTFFNIEGRYVQEQIFSNMEGLEFRKVDFKDTFYYALHQDNEPALDYPLKTHTLNRIAVLDDWFLAAAATRQMQALIGVRDGSSGSLLESKAHRTLAEAAGRGLLTGAFKGPSIIRDPGSPTNFRDLSQGLMQPYVDGPKKWQPLTPFRLTLSGYRVRDHAEEIVMALYYDDPAAAQDDKAKLESRWNTFEWDFATTSDLNLLSDACSPFSAEATKGPDYSLLVASCPITRGQIEDILIDNPYIWKAVPHFVLYPNLDDLNHTN